MLNYHKNELIDECLVRFYETFANTLDTSDYVPDQYNKKILKYIYENMKLQFSKIDREDKLYQRKLKKEFRKKAKQAKKKLKREKKEARLKAKQAKKNKTDKEVK